MKNIIKITFTDSGLVKFETGEFSPAVHGSADRLIETAVQALGGTVEKQKAKRQHTHTHTHDHLHQH